MRQLPATIHERRARLVPNHMLRPIVISDSSAVVNHHTNPLRIVSLPGLAAALRSKAGQPLHVSNIAWHALVQAFRIGEGDAPSEAAAAAHAIRHMADRLHRLTAAYGEWSAFDASAYFDLTVEQVEQLVWITERMTTVHVTVYADLLLPSFRRASAMYSQQFAPAYAQIYSGVEQAERFFEQVQPRAVAHWQHSVAVIRAARDLLIADIGYLAANGAEEERWRWRWAWQQPAAPGVEAELLPPLSTVPTLTLSIDFPLPLSRQPGRRRRLQLHRARRRKKR